MIRPDASTFLNRTLVWGITPARLILAGIVFLSAFLHLVNLESIGDANTYYTAAVKSMLQSWHNWFFVAAEPGGSVTVDKPPLGLWVEAAFALLLGVQGWVVSLPNIMAGILSVPLLYRLVRKHLGTLAGLVAALVLAVTPVAVATDRNNTMDGMLVLILLLAAWAFVAAAESGRARHLFLGAFLLGLGFNIKMLQAFLPLPSFYALYLLGAKTDWGKKWLNIGVSAIILLVVSLWWAVIVDLTPPEQRPYIGSSQDNRVMTLIIGHNALSRLVNPRAGHAPAAPPPPPQALAACADQRAGAGCSFTLPTGEQINGTCIFPPGVNQPACAPRGPAPQSGLPPATVPGAPNVGPNPGGAPFNQETGFPGALRFFVPPLSKQMSWLLPFALVGLALTLLAARLRLPLETEHRAFVLWGSWLLTGLVFFSATEGIFHAYYTIILAPPLGTMVGAGMALFWRRQIHRPWVNVGLLAAAALTVGFQVFAARQYGFQSPLLYLPAVLLVAGAGLLPIRSLRPAAYPVVLAALVTVPLWWTTLTALERAPDVNLPTAFAPGAARQTPPPVDQRLVAFLQAHTQDVEYLAAVPDAHLGAPLALATGRPVLYIGGFGGADAVIDAAGLADMVAKGRLRYVLFGDSPQKREIAQWLAASCAVVPEFGRPGPPDAPANLPLALYRCR